MIEIAVLCIIVISGALCATRALLGPTAPDRIVAIDALVAISVAGMVILGFYYRAQMYLDIAIVYAMLAFIGTLAVAKYIEKGSVGA